MAEKKKLEDVFKTVGLPYTYVKPAYTEKSEPISRSPANIY
jgi:hypothetical protein